MPCVAPWRLQAAVFQLNDGSELTNALYQDAFTQKPLVRPW
jgi:hypothetical protein